MSAFIRQFLCNETGATAIEYGLIAAGISIAIIVAVAGVGSGLNTTFTTVAPRGAAFSVLSEPHPTTKQVIANSASDRQ